MAADRRDAGGFALANQDVPGNAPTFVGLPPKA
jgi:hypothetical protein